MPRAWAIAGASLACLLVGLLLLREPIGRRLFPDAAVAGMLARAEQALAQGDVRAAAAQFHAAQARHPDHPRVASGLAEVRDLALRQAERALSSGDFDAATRSLDEAARLGAPGERVEDLRQRVLARMQPATDVLLQRAAALEDVDAKAALAVYQQVLAQVPADVVARAGRSRLLAAMLRDAVAALDAGDAERAAALVAEVRRLDPAHLQLPDVEMRLGGRGGESAIAVTAGPAPSPAERAEAARWRGLAEEAIGRGAIEEARRALASARALEPAADDLEGLERRLEQAAASPPPDRR